MIINRIKLAKALLQLASVKTDKGEMTFEGELKEGVEVFIESDGEILPAEDGEYQTEQQIIIVSEGKVAEIRDKKEEQPQEEVQQEEEVIVEEPEDVEKEELKRKIEELEKLLGEKDNRIAELEAVLKEREEQLSKSVAKPAKEEIKQSFKKESNLRFDLFSK